MGIGAVVSLADDSLTALQALVSLLSGSYSDSRIWISGLALLVWVDNIILTALLATLFVNVVFKIEDTSTRKST